MFTKNILKIGLNAKNLAVQLWIMVVSALSIMAGALELMWTKDFWVDSWEQAEQVFEYTWIGQMLSGKRDMYHDNRAVAGIVNVFVTLFVAVILFAIVMTVVTSTMPSTYRAAYNLTVNNMSSGGMSDAASGDLALVKLLGMMVVAIFIIIVIAFLVAVLKVMQGGGRGRGGRGRGRGRR